MAKAVLLPLRGLACVASLVLLIFSSQRSLGLDRPSAERASAAVQLLKEALKCSPPSSQRGEVVTKSYVGDTNTYRVKYTGWWSGLKKGKAVEITDDETLGAKFSDLKT